MYNQFMINQYLDAVIGQTAEEQQQLRLEYSVKHVFWNIYPKLHGHLVLLSR